MRHKSNILFENDDLVVLNKAPGILSIADRSNSDAPNLWRWLTHRCPSVLPVHRLDHNTSGLICFAKNRDTQSRLSLAFENREVIKKYKAIVLGVPSQPEGSICARIQKKEGRNEVFISPKGKIAVTNYCIEQEFRGFSLLDLHIETGRTHQIRIHLQYLGHPLLVDPQYGGKESFILSSIKHRYKGDKASERPLLSRTPLHAYHLGLPLANEKFEFHAPLPKDMRAVLNQFEKLLRV